MTSFSVIPPAAEWMTLTRTSGCSIFWSSETAASTEPPTSALSDEVEVLDALAPWTRSNSASSEIGFDRCASCSRRSRSPRACASVTRLALVLDDAADLAGRRRPVEADDLDRVARPGLLDLVAVVVVERAHAAPRVAGDDRVADLSVPRWTSSVATGPRPTSRRDSMIGPDASAFGFARSSSSASATSSTFSRRSREVLLLLRGDLGELRRAAPVLGLEALGRELVLHAVGVRVRQVDLVDRDDDRHLGGARVGDRLLRLRHHAVVGGDDEHGDVRHLRAAGAHGGERLVARRVEERDLAAVVVDLVRADVLRDPARLGLDDRGLADRVEQRRLAVVDVAHDRHDGRPRGEVLLGVLVRLGLELLVGRVLDRHLALQLGGDQLDLLVGERLRRRLRRAERHQDLDDLRHRARRAPARCP